MKKISDLSQTPRTLGVILAGGRARRLGGQDKAFLELNGRPVVAHALQRFIPQCDNVVISANGDPARFDILKLPVLADSLPDFSGPLAGILTTLDWVATHEPTIEWVASVTVDTPFIPYDLVRRLHEARHNQNAQLAMAHSGERNHPVNAIWPVSLRGPLRQAMQEEGLRKVEVWIKRHDLAIATWSTDPIDPFFNINTYEDLELAGDLARSVGVSQL